MAQILDEEDIQMSEQIVLEEIVKTIQGKLVLFNVSAGQLILCGEMIEAYLFEGIFDSPLINLHQLDESSISFYDECRKEAYDMVNEAVKREEFSICYMFNSINKYRVIAK